MAPEHPLLSSLVSTTQSQNVCSTLYLLTVVRKVSVHWEMVKLILDHRLRNIKTLPQERVILRGLSFRKKNPGSSVVVMQKIQPVGKQSQYGLQIMF